MKKVAVLDKSSLSRHLAASNQSSTQERENFENSENFLSNGNSSSTQKSHDSSSSSQSLLSDGSIVPTFNSHLNARSSSSTAKSTRLGVVPNSFSQPRRYMYSKASDRSAAINERIERMARKWTALETSPCTFEDLAHPGRASPVKLTTNNFAYDFCFLSSL